jgi:hypothetical protein
MLATLALALLQRPALPADLDTDRDGLSDFHEVHKHGTDPRAADTDGDRIPDGDWDERREYAYTVRVVMHVLPPSDAQARASWLASATDDYQDVRVLEQRDDALELEVIVYPFNTNDAALAEARDVAPGPALKPWLESTPASNWDEALRTQLVAELRGKGIDPGLPAKELVPRAAAWLMERSKFEDSFTVFAAVLDGSRWKLDPRLEPSVGRDLVRVGRTVDEQWRRELLGRGMFEAQVHGSCTSSAIYLQTGLRALGIPTRTVLCTPAIDANDEREVAWLDARIAHHEIRRVLKRAAQAQAGSWTSHTFNEVWIGGRWRRLNYAELGQNVLDRGGLGLMVHVGTWRDHAESGVLAWGLHSAFTPTDGLFAGPNPYSCVSLSDRFGAHAKIDNPPVDGSTTLTIVEAYWLGDTSVHDPVSMDLHGDDAAGHLIVRVAAGAASDDAEQVREFYDGVAKDFELRPEDGATPPVGTGATLHAQARRGYWIDSGRGVRDFYLRIPPEEYASMRPGTRYELVPPPRKGACAWKVDARLRVHR